MSEDVTYSEILQALEMAADADNEALGTTFHRPQSTSSAKRVTMVREVIKRFCEYIPSHTTAADVLEAINLEPTDDSASPN